MNATAFDAVADTYDRDFSASTIGRAQRRQVWRHLERRVLGTDPLAVLELGCGTGEDACEFAARGHQVHAVDAADDMLTVARRKATTAGLAARIQFEQLDLRELDQLRDREHHFDLVFSNFGPLNCLDPTELASLGAALGRLVRPGGRAVLVVMPRACVWEWVWFLARGRPRTAVRRLRRGPVAAPVGTASVSTWYYGPGQLMAALGRQWHRHGSTAVGLVVPPSYLEPLIARRPRLLGALEAIDRTLGSIPGLAALADHCLVDAERCEGQPA